MRWLNFHDFTFPAWFRQGLSQDKEASAPGGERGPYPITCSPSTARPSLPTCHPCPRD